MGDKTTSHTLDVGIGISPSTTGIAITTEVYTHYVSSSSNTSSEHIVQTTTTSIPGTE